MTWLTDWLSRGAQKNDRTNEQMKKINQIGSSEVAYFARKVAISSCSGCMCVSLPPSSLLRPLLPLSPGSNDWTNMLILFELIIGAQTEGNNKI